MPRPKYDIVVGVDFGTTASAIAYSRSFQGSPSEPIFIYQSSEATASEKIPTVLAYTQENPNLQANEWGFEALGQRNLISWFKLFLDDDVVMEIDSWRAETMDWAFSQGIMSLPPERSSIDTISDYLRALQVRVWEHLNGEAAMTEKILETSTIKFCFTIPENWSTEARDDMLVAIRRAGFASRKFDEICLLTEADAVIVFALSKYGRSLLKTGDGVLDMASFLISDHNSLVYHELVPSSGKLCGSTSVDRELYKLMQNRFGGAFSSLPSDLIGICSSFMSRFMQAKHAFTGSRNAIFKIPLEMNVSQRCNPDCADFLKLFQPSVSTIINCLSEHMREADHIKREPSAINKILLVGGYSRSPFLQSQIRSAFPGTLVLVETQDALTAVVQGATAWGSEKAQLQSMRSPCNFGFASVNPVGFASQSNTFHMNMSSSLDVQNDPITWIVAKGDCLQMNQAVRCKGHWIHQEGDSTTKVINIFYSGKNDRPATVNERGPPIINTLVIDISMVTLSLCEYNTRSARPCRKVDYTISVHLGDSNGTIHFDVYWASVQLAKWEFKPGFIRY
ncbi:hypothetical protein N7528_004888 [Penicillium herquei]|nr:hypothetical protein N7528_004888 [Penicillium herquei]